VCTYFPRGNKEKDQHDSICNLEVVNLVVYKQYVRKSPKVLHMYTKFTPHPRSLDGTSPPTEEMIREFDFSKVNSALANALTAITNSSAANMSQPSRSGVTLEQVTTLITEAKGKMKEYLAQMKEEAIIETHTYIDIVTEDLKEKLDNRFDQLMELLSGTRKVLRGTSPRATIRASEN
jgi:DNA topoisomerase VI subunit B